jgi:hypothetical protein
MPDKSVEVWLLQSLAELGWQAEQSTVMWSHHAPCRVQVLWFQEHTAEVAEPMRLDGRVHPVAKVLQACRVLP